MHALSRAVLRFIALTSVYVLGTWYSDAFILSAGQVTLFWPAAGVAYAIVLLYGWRWSLVVPIAVLIGHLSFAPVPTLFLPFSVLSNFAGALAALWLIAQRDHGIRVTLAGGFLMLRAGVVMVSVSAAIGVVGLIVAGMIPAEAFAAAFVKWSLGDLLGILCIAPGMLLLLAPKRPVPAVNRSSRTTPRGHPSGAPGCSRCWRRSAPCTGPGCTRAPMRWPRWRCR